jgi:hypothetical protein
MKLRGHLLVLLLLLGETGIVLPFGSKEKALSEAKDSRPIEISGVLRLVGNEPFTRLVVSGEDGKDYFLHNSEKETLRRFIGSKIRVKGTLIITKILTADGKDLGDEYNLDNMEIVL